MSSLLPKRVTITDATMREGLQIESPDIPVSEKLRLLDALGETGAKVISIGSFAHPTESGWRTRLPPPANTSDVEVAPALLHGAGNEAHGVGAASLA